jgi:hypothetical protein
MNQGQIELYKTDKKDKIERIFSMVLMVNPEAYENAEIAFVNFSLKIEDLRI